MRSIWTNNSQNASADNNHVMISSILRSHAKVSCVEVDPSYIQFAYEIVSNTYLESSKSVSNTNWPVKDYRLIGYTNEPREIVPGLPR
jgi:hypothetical protein